MGVVSATRMRSTWPRGSRDRPDTLPTSVPSTAWTGSPTESARLADTTSAFITGGMRASQSNRWPNKACADKKRTPPPTMNVATALPCRGGTRCLLIAAHAVCQRRRLRTVPCGALAFHTLASPSAWSVSVASGHYDCLISILIDAEALWSRSTGSSGHEISGHEISGHGTSGHGTSGHGTSGHGTSGLGG